jgi:eukaryotic-like serine/threonine-protein kinase
MGLTPGSQLGPYEILMPLGAGGMGEVYRARDTRLDRTVAIKILPAHLSSDPVRKQRFEREAKVISGLNHPNICVLHDVGSQDGMDYLVMECVEGETLAKKLERGPLPLDQVLKIGQEMAEALDKAHRSGVVHRDLKPGNIMLTPAGAKLLDFGLAKPAVAMATLATLTAATPQHSPVTQEGMIVGTFQYMSPEQVEGKDLDGRSDIFSLGAVLYEMLTGQRTFTGKSQLSVASAILEKDPEPISSAKPMTPPLLDHAIRRCLAKDPEQRWQSARDLALELKWLAQGGAGASENAEIQKRSRATLWIGAGLGLAVLCAGLGAGYLTRPRAPERRLVWSSIVPPEKSSFVESGTAWGALAVSPDGEHIVVGILGENGKPMLYLRALNSQTGQVLPGTEGASFPFWSADGQSIGFFADGEVKRIEAGGGPVQVVCAAPEARGGTWNQDGVIVFAATITGPLYRVSAGGGTATPVTKFDASRNENSHRWPHFLPDGNHFLYLARTAALRSSAINVGSLDGSEPRKVVESIGNASYSNSGYLLYPRGNTLLAQSFDLAKMSVTGDPVTVVDEVSSNGNVQHTSYSISRGAILAFIRSVGAGRSHLQWIHRSGKALESLDQSGAFFAPSLSPDGKKLAVEVAGVNSQAGSDLWIYDLPSKAKTRLTFSPPNGTELNRLPVWSPDGTRVAFSSFRDGHYQIFEKAVNGLGQMTPVYPGEGQRYATSWSSDGRYLVGIEESALSGTGHVVVIPLSETAGKPFQLFPEGTGITLYSFPRVSPDGKWLAYMSNESGRAEIYLTSFPKGEGKWQVSTNGAVAPSWRRDGKELYFYTPDDRVSAASISSAGGAPVISNVRALFWAPLVSSSNWAYDAAPDGQKFLVDTILQSAVAEPITLVENWDVALKKK